MSSETSTDRDGLTQPAKADGAFRPWHFFVLAALVAATVGVLLAREPTPANLVFLSAAIGAAGYVALAFHRTLWPLVASEAVETLDHPGQRSRAALEREKTLVLRSIKELEFDRAMGKVSDEDFQEMAARLRTRAIGLMKQLDQDGSGYRQLIEQELARRLGQMPPAPAARDTAPAVELACAGCGTRNDPDARFCKSCGTRFHDERR